MSLCIKNPFFIGVEASALSDYRGSSDIMPINLFLAIFTKYAVPVLVLFFVQDHPYLSNTRQNSQVV